jgi:CheY-like chemotaxis protein
LRIHAIHLISKYDATQTDITLWRQYAALSITAKGAPLMALKRSTMISSGYTILVIDDQDAILTSVRLLLEREGHTVLTAQDGREGLSLFREQPTQLVIVDYRMSEMNGADVIQALRRLNAHVPILLQSGDTGEQDVQALLYRLDIQGFHDKGGGPDRLLEWVDALLNAAPQWQQPPQQSPRFSHILEDCLPSLPLWRSTAAATLAM